MARKRKRGNYSQEDRRLILEAAVSEVAGSTITEKQNWLLLRGVHSPGNPMDPVSESAINYWKNVHRKVTLLAKTQYDNAMATLIESPPSYRALKEKLPSILTGSQEDHD